MLNAILNGKKLGTGLQGVRLSDDFIGAEDSLTSTVFERLLYLPDEQLIKVIFDPTVWPQPLVPQPREIRRHKFWPWWDASAKKPAITPGASPETVRRSDASDPGERERWIQPDLVIEFDTCALIVEAKRWDFVGPWQSPSQLATQFARASARFPGKPVWCLAVGGLTDVRRSTKDALRDRAFAELQKLDSSISPGGFRFAALAWRELFEIAIRSLPEAAFRRLICDLRAGLAVHGIRTEPPHWLIELASETTVGQIKASPATFSRSLDEVLRPTLNSPSSVLTLSSPGNSNDSRAG